MPDPMGTQPTSDPGFVPGGTPAPPDTSSLPVSARPAPNPLGAPTLPAPNKHELLGRFVKHVTDTMAGHKTIYTPDPKTGDIVESQVPRRPGDIFKDIVTGALLGGAAGANAPRGSGPLGGLASGGAAVLNNNQANDSRAKNRAVESAGRLKAAQDQENQQQTQETLAQAAVAHDNISSFDLGHNIGLHNDQEVDALNKATAAIQAEALKAGGALASVEGNGEKGNGPALMQRYNQDPSIMQGPEGFHRLMFVNHDTGDLKYAKGQWVDPAKGLPPDWNAHSTVTLVDLPNGSWAKTVHTTKGVANTVAQRTVAQGKDSDPIDTTYGSLFGLGLKSKQDMNLERRVLLAPIKNDADYKGQKAKLDALREKPDEDLSDDDKNFIEKRGPIIDKYKPKEQAPTKAQMTVERNNLEQSLSAGNISKEDRAKLVTLQKADPIKGVPADIVAAIGDKPVPAEYAKGAKDPVYIAANKLWGDASLKKKSTLQAQAGLARYKELGRIRDYNVIDSVTGQMSAMNSEALADKLDAEPGRYVLATQDGTKTMAKGAALKDIQFNVKNTREKLAALPDLDAKTRAQIVLALHNPNPESALKTFLTSEAGQALNDKQQDAVVALNSIAENVMLARSLQGVGGAGSDMMRQALLNLVPTGKTLYKGMVEKQLDTLSRTMDQISTGVPSFGKASREPVQPKDAKQPTAAPPAKGFTRIQSSDGHLHDIPSGNLDAAKKIDPKLTVVGQ